ncbi:MAG: PBECR4 domain-containing protein [Eubacteriales bacterium]
MKQEYDELVYVFGKIKSQQIRKVALEQISFKERVRKAAIDGAQLYKKNFVDCEYLICSKAFNEKQYYVAKADKSNYLHLIGVHTELTPEYFFEKCYISE